MGQGHPTAGIRGKWCLDPRLTTSYTEINSQAIVALNMKGKRVKLSEKHTEENHWYLG